MVAIVSSYNGKVRALQLVIGDHLVVIGGRADQNGQIKEKGVRDHLAPLGKTMMSVTVWLWGGASGYHWLTTIDRFSLLDAAAVSGGATVDGLDRHVGFGRRRVVVFAVTLPQAAEPVVGIFAAHLTMAIGEAG